MDNANNDKVRAGAANGSKREQSGNILRFGHLVLEKSDGTKKKSKGVDFGKRCRNRRRLQARGAKVDERGEKRKNDE